ncbi:MULTISPECIES: FRG domain-containing protein [unclassified Maridesulfovibrio]|uniref:FRG domain-containing protein n=1 Tax=unclassified Maridesulfovibrio TaxID=2794999 RepID=UPI003B3E4A29
MNDSEDIKNYDDLPVWTPKSSEIVFGTSKGELGEKIPSLRLESWEHFTPFISDSMFHDPESEFIFRGQRRSDWRLMPSLSRNTSDGIITKKLADKQLANFKKAARGRLSDSNIVAEEDELWAIGQHYGLKTPLLDWTYSPYVALFFSFFQPDPVAEDDNPYRAVYILNKDRLNNNFNDLKIKILEPEKDDQGRLVSQAGLFTVSPQDATFENKIVDVVTQDSFLIDGKRYGELSVEEGVQALGRFVCKVYIKNDSPQGCIRLLRRMNVHHASLFPDLIGASEYCNLIIDESGFGSKGKTIKVEPITECFHVTEVKKLNSPLVNSSHTSKDEDGSYPIAKSVTDLIVSRLFVFSISDNDLLDLANKLVNTLEEYKVTDWQVKESAHARFKNITRTMLRNYNIPEEFRTPIVEQIVETMIREDENKEEQ